MDHERARQAMGLFLQVLKGRARSGQKTLQLGPAEREMMRRWPELLGRTVAGEDSGTTSARRESISAADSLAAARRRLRGEEEAATAGAPPVHTKSSSTVRDSDGDDSGVSRSGASHSGDSRVATELLPTDGATKEERIASLERKAVDWKPAMELGSLRPTLVFSTGNAGAQIMLVGEAPGAEEELRREPFVGPAGKLLDKILKAMGLERREIYISNVCKFRPLMEGQDSRNRKPTAEEMRACLPFILTEIDVVRPRMIVALGSTAAEGLLGLTDPVGRLRARVHGFGGTPAVVTYHPSYLLRNQALSEKRKVWEDMMLVMETLGMPISERQRGFFLKG